MSVIKCFFLNPAVSPLRYLHALMEVWYRRGWGDTPHVNPGHPPHIKPWGGSAAQLGAAGWKKGAGCPPPPTQR